MRIATFALLLAVTNAFSTTPSSQSQSSRTSELTKLQVSTTPTNQNEVKVGAETRKPPRQQQIVDSYNLKIKRLSTATIRDRRAAEKAERLLREMLAKGLPPNQLSFTNTIVAWSRTKDKTAPHRAQALLTEMKELFKQNDTMQPSKVPYTAVITAWSKSRDRNAGRHALQLLQEMKDTGTKFCSPNAVTYGACISAVGPARAIGLLDELQQLYDKGDHSCRPDTIVYSSAISALAKTPGNYKRAHDLLYRMERDYDRGLVHLKPNHFSYSAALTSCWDRFSPEESLTRAEYLLNHVKGRHEAGLSDIQPNTVVYNGLLDVCSQCQSIVAAEKALLLLREMQTNPACQPDSITYCTVITAFSRSGDARCGQMAVDLLQDMITTRSGGGQVKPNTFVYGAAIAAQAKCGDAATAQRLFDEMLLQNCLPNTIVYNSLISACRSSTRALSLLQEMYRRNDQGEKFVKPNTITYNTVLGALAASSASPPQAAQALLEDMKRRTAAREPGVRPDSVTYSILIGIWTEAGPGFEAAQRVETLLEEMGRLR